MELPIMYSICNAKWMKAFDFPGRETNPTQVSLQKTLLVILPIS